VKLALLLALPLFSQTSQFTDHTDNSRLATVTDETKLTPANVAAISKLTTLSLDGRVYTAPLYIPNLSFSGTLRNVIFAGSSNNSMYAWDADSFTLLWTTGALDAPCSTSCGGFKWGLNYDQTVGIFSAPVIDVASGWLFVVSHTNTPTYKLYKLNLTTGATISSTTLTASVSPSTASDAVSGTLTFNPDQSTQRAGLTLANGNVYVMFSSVRDVAPWHGWIMARKETDLSDIGDFCTNWNQNGGGIWMSNSGASVDASGNLYVVTGNGGNGFRHVDEFL
jgi:outer membrane protein assembly factor BamB